MASTKFAGVRAIAGQFAFRSASLGSTSKSRQTSRIKKLGASLTASGLVTLGEQARALGLSRSSAWALLKANHKASSLAAATINRMLSSPELPPRARATILTYIEEKLAGLYGHNKEQLSRFKAGFSNRGHSSGSFWWPGPSLSKRKKARAGTSPETGLTRGMAFPRATAPSKREDAAGRADDTTRPSPSLNQMNRRSNDPSQRIISRKRPPPFAGWNKPQWALLLLLVFAGNVLVATIAWIIVRLVTR
jgi:hypothetical protein